MAKVAKPPDTDKPSLKHTPSQLSEPTTENPLQDTRKMKGVRCMADIQSEKITWLWPGYLAAGKLSLLIGDPGLGKSTLTCEIAARLSLGQALPGADSIASLSCGFCCAEDDPADTIRPRLDAAEVDLRRVFVFDDVHVFPDDLPTLEEHIRQSSIGLVIIDPIMSFLSGKLSAHKDQDVRRALTPLTEIAQRTGCTVLVVMHLNKQMNGPAVYRAGGSIGFVGTARTVMLLAKDPDDSAQRILAQVKNNLAKERKAYRLSLENSPGHEVARILWRGECEQTADVLCGPPESAENRLLLDDAKEFLRECLADGPKPRTDVLTLAKQADVSERTLRRARHALGIPKKNVWALPVETAPHGAP